MLSRQVYTSARTGGGLPWMILLRSSRTPHRSSAAVDTFDADIVDMRPVVGASRVGERVISLRLASGWAAGRAIANRSSSNAVILRPVSLGSGGSSTARSLVSSCRAVTWAAGGGLPQLEPDGGIGAPKGAYDARQAAIHGAAGIGQPKRSDAPDRRIPGCRNRLIRLRHSQTRMIEQGLATRRAPPSNLSAPSPACTTCFKGDVNQGGAGNGG